MKKNFLPEILQKILLLILFIILTAVFLSAQQFSLDSDLLTVFYWPVILTMATASALVLIWTTTALIKQRIIITQAPIIWPFLLLLLVILMSSFFNYSLDNHLSWLAGGGFGLSLVFILLAAGSLFSPRQTKLALNLSNLWALLMAIFVFLQGCELLFNFHFLPFKIQLLPTSWLAIFLAFLSGIIAVFIRKGKNSPLQKILLPFLIFGFIGLGILIYKQPSSLSETANLRISWQALKTSWTASPVNSNQALATKIFQPLLGYGSESYASFYQLFKPSWVNQSVWDQSNFTQSSLGILTIFSTLGLLGGAAFIWLVIFLWKNLAWQFNQGNYFFLLATIIWTIQLFIPLEAPLLFLATFLLAISCWTGPKLDWSRSLRSSRIRVGWGNILGIGLILIAIWSGWRIIVNLQTRNFYQLSQASWSDYQSNTKSNDKIEKIAQLNQKALTLQPHFDFLYREGSLNNLETTLAYLRQTNDITPFDLTQQNKNLNNSLYLARQAVLIAPHVAKNWLSLGNIYRDIAQVTTQAQNIQQLAQAAYLQAAQLEPQNSQALLDLGRLALDQGNLSEAESYFIEATALQPRLVEAHFYLANTYQLEKKVALAKESYQTALSLLDREATTYNDNYQLLTEKINQLGQG